jgi:hypothetical protein
MVADAYSGSPDDYGSRWTPPGSLAGQRPPRDCSIVVVSDAFTGTTEEFIYDAQDRTWQDLSALMLDSEAPLSRRDRDGLSAALAMQIADEYGGDISPLTVRLAQGFRSALCSRYSTPSRLLQGVYL